MSETHICAQCAASGPSCCQLTRIFVTIGDYRRIRESGYGDDFYDHKLPRPNANYPATDLDPLWYRTFTHPAGRRVLRRTDAGDCMFLRATGCILPLDIRPLVCRLYPFDYTSETIKGVHAHRCPIAMQDNTPLLMALLGMNRDEAEEWRRALYEEIAEEYGAE